MSRGDKAVVVEWEVEVIASRGDKAIVVENEVEGW